METIYRKNKLDVRLEMGCNIDFNSVPGIKNFTKVDESDPSSNYILDIEDGYLEQILKTLSSNNNILFVERIPVRRLV